MCEELEYSELLDKAADTDDPVQRMCLVAAFSVSPYASTFYRAGTKPFNPLLGETYECIREDKGWRFLAEQVCASAAVRYSNECTTAVCCSETQYKCCIHNTELGL